MCYTRIFFLPGVTIIFEKSVQLVGCVWQYASGRAQCSVRYCSTCDSSPCDMKVEEDGQKTKTMMFPATFT